MIDSYISEVIRIIIENGIDDGQFFDVAGIGGEDIDGHVGVVVAEDVKCCADS
jgi:hypothetical protein